MQREIKFRCWDVQAKKMFVPKEIPNGLIGAIPEDDDGQFFVHMQYIDLKDKNGTLIYEGDVLSILTQAGKIELFEAAWGIHRRQMKSGWTVDIPGFSFISKDGFPSFPIVDNYQNVHDLSMIEIVGNRYEHPELLED